MLAGHKRRCRSLKGVGVCGGLVASASPRTPPPPYHTRSNLHEAPLSAVSLPANQGHAARCSLYNSSAAAALRIKGMCRTDERLERAKKQGYRVAAGGPAIHSSTATSHGNRPNRFRRSPGAPPSVLGVPTGCPSLPLPLSRLHCACDWASSAVLLRSAYLCLCVIVQELLQRWCRIDHVVRTGVDTAVFDPRCLGAADRDRLRCRLTFDHPDAFLVLYVGRCGRRGRRSLRSECPASAQFCGFWVQV